MTSGIITATHSAFHRTIDIRITITPDGLAYLHSGQMPIDKYVEDRGQVVKEIVIDQFTKLLKELHPSATPLPDR